MRSSFECLTTLLANDYGLAPGRLVPQATLETLGIDSLRAVELFWSIEEAFGIRMPLHAVPLRTLADVAAWIDQLVAAQGGRATLPGAASAALPGAR